jgi:vitamin B12 transporter
MLRLTLTFIALLAGLVAATQTQVSGRVLNARKKPLAGVNITIKDSYDGATSDSLGNFNHCHRQPGGAGRDDRL